MANKFSKHNLALRNQILKLTNSIELYELALQVKQEKAIERYKKDLYVKFEKHCKEVAGNADDLQAKKQNAIKKYDAKQYWPRKALTHRLSLEIAELGVDAEAQSAKAQLEEKCNAELAVLDGKRETFIANLEAKYNKKLVAGTMSAEEAQKNIDEVAEKCQNKIDNHIVKVKEQYENTLAEFKTNVNEKINVLKEELKSQLTHQDEMADDEIIRLDGLCMYFGGLKAVDDLSFAIKKGEIFGLIGPNGAGKTTVFNCITQFYNPTAGSVYYRNNSDEVMLLNGEKAHDVINYGIVRTFQNVELVWELSVLDNLLVAAHSAYNTGLFAHMINSSTLRKEERLHKAKALEVLEYMGLSEFAYRIPYGLPYGVLKRIELARTLMTQPKLIILDEPAAGLNDQETEELAQLIKRIRDEKNVTIVLVEHDMGLVMSICDKICAISFGRRLAVGTPEEIQQDKGVQEAYLGAGEDD